MKAKPLTQHYPYLTPEDRFRLILAASGRGDEVERDRLIRAGKHITVSRQDHAPYAYAFQEVSRLTFLQVIEEVRDTSTSWLALPLPSTSMRATRLSTRQLPAKRRTLLG